ncbi:MAG: hypothetical protein GY772_16715 [bacterium]|nr:hypothetical protein [bacterium]
MAAVPLGDRSSAQAAAKHSGPFIYTAYRDGRPFSSMALRWCAGLRRCTANGLTGSAELELVLPRGTLGLRPGSTFRVHVCAKEPCTALYHPSKYGLQEPPLLHGRVASLLPLDADVAAATTAAYTSTVVEDWPGDAGVAAASTAAHTSTVVEDCPEDADVAAASTAAHTSTVVAECPGDLAGSPVSVTSVAESVGETSDLEERAPEHTAPPGADAAVKAAIMTDWAEKVARVGEYVGFFTFLVFAVLRRRRFFVRFGGARCDVLETFAPWALQEGRWGPNSNVDAVACRLHAERGCEAISDEIPPETVNHYVAGVSFHLGNSAERDTHAVAGIESIETTYRRHGVGILRTAADGDCGIDVLTIADGIERSLLNRCRLRRELEAFAVSVAGEVRWQEAFRSCQEVPDAALRHAAAPPPLPPPPRHRLHPQCQRQTRQKDSRGCGEAAAELPSRRTAAVAARRRRRRQPLFRRLHLLLPT